MKYTLFTKHEIKMAGYWPSPVFAFLCTRIKSKSKRTKKTKKKEWGSTLIRIKNDLLIFILLFSFVFFGFHSIITSWQSFTFSLFWLSSAPFCSSIAQINQKLQTTGMEVCTTQLFFQAQEQSRQSQEGKISPSYPLR